MPSPSLLLLLLLYLPWPAAWQPWLGPPLRRACVAGELLDVREVYYYLTRPDDWSCDLRTLRGRAWDLLDAPPLFDCYRLPARATAQEMMAFNRAYRLVLEARQAAEPGRWQDYQDAIGEADRLWGTLDLIRDARTDYLYLGCRRQALARLRERIGAGAYWQGTWPPAVPLERFKRVP